MENFEKQLYYREFRKKLRKWTMGQQQLLLIVLALIVIAISVAIANQLFNASAEDSNKDTIISELTNLATISLQYYRKPASVAGGGRSFTNW